MPRYLKCVIIMLFTFGFLTTAAQGQSWPTGDLDGDYKVDSNDLMLFIDQWLDPSGCSGLGCADIDGQNGINFVDLAMLAQNWGVGYDINPPVPNPATWATEPYATGSDTITMTATTGYDDSEPVEYYFDETSGNPGGSDSDWQNSPTYTDTGLSPETEYTYTVQMRDSLENTGTASSPASATTEAPQELFISEFMASNDSTFEDPDESGEYPDWIEIYNASDHTIDLSGMYLTDDNDEPTKWQIPSGITINAGSYIVFYADDDDEQGDYHTNFKLSADGEDIYLYDDDAATLVDGISFDEQYSDISYGRYPDSSNNWRYMGYPTPGSANNDGYLGQVEDTKFSVDRGFYEDPFQVRLACDTDDAEIRYTLDGKDPIDPNGSVYDNSSPIQITETTILRAAAHKAGWLSSNTDTQTYIFLDDIINQPSSAPDSNWPSSSVNGQVFDYGMDTDITTDPEYVDLMDDALLAIPSISLVTDMDNLVDPDIGIYVNCGAYGQPGWERGPAWRRPVSVELINPDGTKGFQIDAGLGMRGITSCKDQNPKHAFRLFFDSQYGDSDLEYPLFGDEGASRFDKIDLRCEQNWSWSMDNSAYHTAVREVFCRDLQGQTGQPYTRSRYYHLYLNGVYWGLYQTQERAEASYGETYFGGDSDDYDTVKSNRSWPRSMECTDGTFDAYKRLWQTCVDDDFANNSTYYKVQGLNTDGTVNPSYERLVDVNNLIDYMLTIFYTGDYDAPISGWHSNNIPNNFFGLYNRENPDGFKYFRHDGEHAMVIEYYGESGLNRTGPFTASSLMNFIEGCPVEPFPSQTCIGFNPQTLHQYLTDNTEYVLHFADRAHKFMFNDGPMEVENAQALFASRAAEVDMAIIAESARWGSASLDKNTWLNRISFVLNFLDTRTDTVLGQLQTQGWYPSVAAPEFYVNGTAQHGGLITPPDSLTMSAAAGTIYYTLDGSDPRTPLTGGIHGTQYTGAITLNSATLVKARAYSGGDWSALSEAYYSGSDVQNNLRITEIMYHPQDTGDPDDPNKEFIELTNIGTSSISLRWAKFTEGIHFTFPNVSLAAGGHIVVVKDTNAFTSEYGSGIAIAGQYTGSLANNGERIKLEDAIDNTILDFEYKDGWRNITDGEGYSLTINNENNVDPNTWATEDSWSASTYLGGAPGYGDTGPKWGNIVINEILAHQDSYPEDWVELHNTTDSAINVTGWYLSDDDANLTKYELPSTVIPAGGYVVFTEDDHFGSYFALSENGEVVCLTSAKDANEDLTGYRQKEDFGASERDISFGRHLKSTGTYNFVPMSAQTSGAANAYPKVGPVIISEIMYRPEKFWSDWNAEYIELYNTSESTVNLYDSNGVGWKFTNGINFTFPSDVSIASHSYLLVVRDEDVFNTEYPGVPGGVEILEWDSGKLDNDGEKIEISMPGEMDEESVQHYIRIDRVVYSNGSHPEDFDGVTDPWPTAADGKGYSLTKIDYSLYGNDPNAWAAYVPSPGQAGSPPATPSKATNPDPNNGATGQPKSLTLSWEDGGGAISYDVYFGTDSTPDETEYKLNTSATSYEPGTLLYSTTYYWRIDSTNLEGTTTGDIWSFTTMATPPPQKAINPDPEDESTIQGTSAILSWSDGGDATDYDVYLSTDSTIDGGDYQTNTTSTSYATGSLLENYTYYWRIDANNSAGTATGDVWSFTTGEQAAALVDLDASSLDTGSLSTWTNNGSLGGSFSQSNNNRKPNVETVSSVKAVTFDGSNDRLQSSFTAPLTVTGNGTYTVAIWAYNPSISQEECMYNWAHRGGGNSTCAQINFGNNAIWGAVTHWGPADMGFDSGVPSASAWHHIAVTFDGSTEIVYVDGTPNATESKTLNMHSGGYIYLGCAYNSGTTYEKYFSGSVASIQMYDDALSAGEIAALAAISP